MKKLLALLLAVVMIFTLVACGGNNAKDDDDDDKGGQKVTTTAPVETNPLVGKWGTKIIVDAAKMEMEGMDATLEMVIEAEFKDDDTYKMYIDEDALRASIDKFVDDVIDSMIEMMYEQFAEQEMTKEQVDDMILSTYGMSLEEFCETTVDTLDIDSIFEEAKDEFVTTGTYRVDGDKLYMLENEKDDAEEKPEEELYTFELKDGKLSIASDEEDFKEMLDFIGAAKLEFTKK